MQNILKVGMVVLGSLGFFQVSPASADGLMCAMTNRNYTVEWSDPFIKGVIPRSAMTPAMKPTSSIYVANDKLGKGGRCLYPRFGGKDSVPFSYTYNYPKRNGAWSLKDCKVSGEGFNQTLECALANCPPSWAAEKCKAAEGKVTIVPSDYFKVKGGMMVPPGGAYSAFGEPSPATYTSLKLSVDEAKHTWTVNIGVADADNFTGNVPLALDLSKYSSCETKAPAWFVNCNK